jgi:outer membrane protein
MKKYILLPIIFLLFNLCNAGASPTASHNQPDLNQLEILNLQTAGRIALSKNPSLSAARSRVKQAKLRMDQARSTYWPSVNAIASYSRTDISNNTYQTNLASARLFNPSATLTNPDNYYTAGIQAVWILFDGFERKYLNASAQYGKELSEFQREDVKRLLLAAVSETYFMAQLSAENIKISMADESFNQRLLDEAKARIQLGTGSLSDKLNFEIRVNAAKARLLNFEKIYNSTLHGLSAMMGLPAAAFPQHLKLADLTPDSQDGLSPMESEDLLQYALENRFDLLGYNSMLKASESEIEMARSNYYPSVSLSASFDGNRTGDASFGNDDFNNSVGVNFSYNLFSGGSDRAKLREAKEKKNEAKQNLESSKLTIIREVRQAIEDVDMAQKALALQRANATLVQKNRNLVEKEYAAGQSSLVRLNEAQRDMIAAQSRLVLSLVSLRMATFNLESSTGSILEKFE